MNHSTHRQAGAKSRTPKYPLWLHAPSGQWCKKVRGHRFYFGTDRDAALAEYVRVKDDLEAGRTPRPIEPDGMTLHRLVDAFLKDKRSQRDGGEITTRSFAEYYRSCEILLDHFGKTIIVSQIRPDDLMGYRRKLSVKRNANSLGNEVGRVRVVFNYAFQNGLIDAPIRFGQFKKPAKRVLRRQRAEDGPRMFEADAIRQLLDNAGSQLRAMILLGVNCGMGNSDCAKLQFRHLKLDSGWLDFPRPKTGIARRCPLWPETVEALRTWLSERKPPHDEADAAYVFITKYGKAWSVEGSSRNPISAEFRKLATKIGVHKDGCAFYGLRHTFQTVGEEACDSVAIKFCMGHADGSISDTYRERFPDERLRKVVDHVRTWLYGKGGV